MPRPISLDLRNRVVAAVERKEGNRAQIAARFGVGEASVGRWSRKKRATGSAGHLRMGTRKPRFFDNPEDLESLHFIVLDNPTLTLREILERFVEEGGKRVSLATIGRGLKRLGITRKKTARSPRSKTRRG